jgi:hypothetical protein
MPVPSTTILTDNLPKGLDWADGLNGRIGTPLPPNAVAVEGSQGENSLATIPVQEDVDSPELEIAEQGTCKHWYTMPYSLAIMYSSIYVRGSLVYDSFGNYFRVLSTTTKRMNGNQATFTVVSESISFDTPPDEFAIQPVTLGIDILKHPRYFFALMPTNQIPNYRGTQDTPLQAQAKMAIIRGLQAYRENPQVLPQNNIASMAGFIHDIIGHAINTNSTTLSVANPNFNPGVNATQPPKVGTLFSGNPYPPAATLNGQPNPQFYFVSWDGLNDPGGSVALAFAAAQEILAKLWRQEDTPELVGWEITHSSYFYIPPSLNPGGYIENPFYGATSDPTVKTAVPPIPNYFTSTTWPPTASPTIFDMIGWNNPQCYAANGQLGGAALLQCLREADNLEFQRTWFKLIRKWKVTAIGQFDYDLYSGGPRPTLPYQYRSWWT